MHFSTMIKEIKSLLNMLHMISGHDVMASSMLIAPNNLDVCVHSHFFASAFIKIMDGTLQQTSSDVLYSSVQREF